MGKGCRTRSEEEGWGKPATVSTRLSPWEETKSLGASGRVVRSDADAKRNTGYRAATGMKEAGETKQEATEVI